MAIKKLKSFIDTIAKADTPFYLLPPIMILLFWGTLAQKWMGLYGAQHKFFSSFYFHVGFFPLPGGYTFIGALSFCLLLKFVFCSQWSWQRCGIILSHLGVLVLIIGGLLTSITAKEGFMVLPEGSESPYVYDYHSRELFVFKDEKLQSRFEFSSLHSELFSAQFPFKITVLFSCKNCKIVKTTQDKNYKGMARFMNLESIPDDLNPEKDFSGAILKIDQAGKKQDGIYIVFEGMPAPIEIKTAQGLYKIIFGKQQRLLPFSLRLVDFSKTSYPGTQIASAYHSDIVILDKGVEWPTRIEMNKPLRYKGYTFYQSSFEQAQDLETSILAVVENKGQVFPYLGSGIISIGLLLHIFIATKLGNRA